MYRIIVLLWLLISPLHCSLFAAELRVAVASNFLPTLLKLQPMFKNSTGHDLLISSASSGQIYAQLRHGAPYDVFMSADVKRPRRLVAAGLAVDLQLYAQGQLLLVSNLGQWQPCEQVLQSDQVRYLALANPDLAPYGAAAKQFLQSHQLWDRFNGQRVLGENVAQALQLVVSKNATVGLVAASQLMTYQLDASQCSWAVPPNQYEPINQAMVLNKASDKQAVYSAFKAFLQSPVSQDLLKQHGYQIPGAQ